MASPPLEAPLAVIAVVMDPVAVMAILPLDTTTMKVIPITTTTMEETGDGSRDDDVVDDC